VAHLEKELKVPSHEFCRALGAVLHLTPAEQQTLLEEVEDTSRQRAAARRQQRGSAARGAVPPPAWQLGAWLSPYEEQQVRQAFEEQARRRHAEPPPLGDSEEASGVPQEVEEARRHRTQAWLQSRQSLQSRGFPIDVLERAMREIAEDPEMSAAYGDLQTALAHPQWRAAVLLALRAFAQAAQASTTTPPQVPHIRERPDVQAHLRQGDPLIGESPKMREVSRLIEQAQQTTAAVLIRGEPGTGKERLACLIHAQGPRREGPFIAVRCAAIPEVRLEAELFGAEQGAVTGALQRQPGHLELAAGGTLFLDEIAALSPILQAKVLRALQENRFARVGGTAPIATDARIIAATSQDLEQRMAEGTFRRDLFHRLNVYLISLPPLRERVEDVIPLALHFLRQYCQKRKKEVVGLSREAMDLLTRYAWPGNVGELEEVIERALILCQGTIVTPQELSPELGAQPRAAVGSGEAIKPPAGGISLAEKQLIQQALEQAHGNQSQAGKLLGLSRTQLRTRLKHYGLEAD
jgi:DNA-binding NtrC family response regulator